MFYPGKLGCVSILVLMEDVKERVCCRAERERNICFNPCFNGRCKRTILFIKVKLYFIYVSILVLMEDVKEHKFKSNLGQASY